MSIPPLFFPIINIKSWLSYLQFTFGKTELQRLNCSLQGWDWSINSTLQSNSLFHGPQILTCFKTINQCLGHTCLSTFYFLIFIFKTNITDSGGGYGVSWYNGPEVGVIGSEMVILSPQLPLSFLPFLIAPASPTDNITFWFWFIKKR